MKDLLYETIAGLCTGFAVSPINLIVDKAVIQQANGKIPLWQSVMKSFNKLFTQPKSFFTSFQFKWIFAVYFPTYTASNLADHFHVVPMVNPAINKLILTFLVNTITSLLKDRALAQRLSTQQIRPFPISALGFLFARDIVAILGGFIFPQPLGSILSQKANISRKKGYQIAQLTVPLLIQFIGTPLHLIGLDLYNRPGQTIKSRFTYIKKIFPQILALRMLRFLPAYGIGGIVNTQLRQYFEVKKKQH